MYELMLDTANLDELKAGIALWPVVGVTSNPSILKAEGKIDIYERLAEIKALCGPDRSLHVQVVSDTTDEIVKEAHYILEKLGKDVFIKIPVSNAGLPAIKILAAEGVNITATAIYSSMQGMLAVLAGAKYIAIYYNRMENNCTDPKKVCADIREFIEESGSDALLLGASFKNVAQVTEAFVNGCQSVTVAPSLVKSALGMASIDQAVANFAKDFYAVHGEGETMMTIG
ncbi:MAG: fructose-6-phosphate aldolase [Clostridia bacterium]|nr:fructose-6-phosphate aldolase [Clostridia bacterium]